MTVNKESFHFKKRIISYFNYEENGYYRILGIDNEIGNCDELFFITHRNKSPLFCNDRIELPAQSWISTNTFRNTLYLETLLHFTNINAIDLMFAYKGKMRIKVWQARKGLADKLLTEVCVYSEEKTHYLINLGTIADLGHDSRVFWQIDSLATDVTLYDASYVSKTKPKECRLVILLRTFGRTEDIKAILKAFTEAAEKNPYYATLLESINFWVLDTTQGCEKDYTETWQQQLNLKVIIAPNLGGGGNAGHLLALFNEVCQTSSNPPTEILIMDDDLIISMESLARYFMFCAYKQQDVICSVPILMKSRPDTVWEDGGFWGRRNFDIQERTLYPSLVKHGLKVSGQTRNGDKNLNRFCGLNVCEYSTFIFFGLSLKTLAKLDYPVAFFLRGDDIEFSLRAHKHGIPLITNPNLTTWHEPAHSYAQEYMAILHGIIINFAYSDEPVESYANFFQERLCEHLSIDDEAGLSVYATILQDIIDPQSAILTQHFQQHYLDRLKKFAQIAMTVLEKAEFSAFEKAAKAEKKLLVPFVHGGYFHNVAKNFNGVVVFNQAGCSYRELYPLSAAKKNQLLSEYVKLLSEFIGRFAEIQQFWQTRLAETAQAGYWLAVKAYYADKTELIYENLSDVSTQAVLLEFKGNAEQRLIEAKTSVFIRQLKAKLARMIASKKQPKQRKAAVLPPALLANLPADFDAQVYLEINQDVSEAGVDPVAHYLKYGIQEGRRYWI